MADLGELLRGLSGVDFAGDPDLAVRGIAYDSRMVKPGDLFVALPGFHSDGAQYIPVALERGAVAVVTQRGDAPVPEGTPRLLVPDARRALTDLSAAFYRYPARELRVVGVTGTDGKTTTTYLVSAVLEAMGFATGLITTVEVKVGSRFKANETQHTTPEPVEVQGLLREMVDEGVEYAVLEASSHALALDRLLHCEFDAAVFTNLSPEHLNFHGSMENYRRDKARLFALLDRSIDKGVAKTAVLNADDPNAPAMRRATHARAIWYGIEPSGLADPPLPPGEDLPQNPSPHGRGVTLRPLASRSEGDLHIHAADIELMPNGSRFLLVTPRGSIPVESRLSGRFNVYNWLAAAVVGLSQGADLEQLRAAIGSVDSVPGRVQRVDRGQPFAVVVDFAHTPQALQTVLSTLRSTTPGRLIVLFGLAGERDPGNRAEMGRIAARIADFAIFTTDDPRYEDPMDIAEEIASGSRDEGWREGVGYLKIADREEAIREACRRAGPGDAVLLAGKGHEKRQVIGSSFVPWNDAEVAWRVLGELGY